MTAMPGAVPIPESRFAGSLIGLATGDALGLVSENLSRRAIRKRFGQVDSFRLLPGRAYVSDDTEQAMALAASLAEHAAFDALDFARRLRYWFWTLPPFIGLATVRACVKLSLGFGPRHSGVNSAGNGSAMRAPAVGLLFAGRPEELIQAAADSALVTHTHPRAIAGTVAVALAVAELAGSASPPDPARFLALLAETAARYDADMAEAIARIGRLLSANPDEALDQIGTTGYVLHTVPAALYCFLRTPGSFRDTVITAASAGGDTDTIAAIAGAISGACNGVEAVPAEWVRALERAPGCGRAGYILDVAASLHKAALSRARQPAVPLSVLSVARARIEFYLLLAAHIFLRAIWFFVPGRASGQATGAG